MMLPSPQKFDLNKLHSSCDVIVPFTKFQEAVLVFFGVRIQRHVVATTGHLGQIVLIHTTRFNFNTSRCGRHCHVIFDVMIRLFFCSYNYVACIK